MQVNDCLAGAGEFDKSVDYSMRQDAAKVLQNGRRIAQCMIKCVRHAEKPSMTLG